jgi:hypothetical protein
VDNYFYREMFGEIGKAAAIEKAAMMAAHGKLLVLFTV